MGLTLREQEIVNTVRMKILENDDWKNQVREVSIAVDNEVDSRIDKIRRGQYGQKNLK